MSDAKALTVGRPSSFTPEIAERICAELAGGKSLRKICAADGMPDKVTVLRWLHRDEEFRTQYREARESQAEVLADEMVDIADDSTNDYMDRELGDGKTERVLDGENINRSRLRINTRQWVAARLLPKKYGDRPAGETVLAMGAKDGLKDSGNLEILRRLAYAFWLVGQDTVE